MKKLLSAAGTRSRGYTLPARNRSISASGVRSISTTSSAAASASSGIVSRTRVPVSWMIWSLRLSRCCTLTVEYTSMPAFSTSCDVFVALLVLDARRVGVGQLVDQAELGFAREHGREVHLREGRAAVVDHARRDVLQPLGLRGGLVAAVGLEVADRHVPARLGLRAALLQHAVGLAHARPPSR